VRYRLRGGRILLGGLGLLCHKQKRMSAQALDFGRR
jgi:hypothetical protein